MAKFKNRRKALRNRTVWRDFFMLSIFVMLFGAALTAIVSDGPLHQMKGAWVAQAIR
jgi:ABC-type microcin C transport system permease subunit YejE